MVPSKRRRNAIARVATWAAVIVSIAGCGDGSTVGSTPGPKPSFFVSSTGTGAAGGNLGGLAGADAKCQRLASTADMGHRRWRAYLSTTTEDARDRIGTGPWFNANLVQVAEDVEALHQRNLRKIEIDAFGEATVFSAAVDEYGVPPPERERGILTGSDRDGRLMAANLTCDDWTSDSGRRYAQVGRADIDQDRWFSRFDSWNSAYDTLGCNEASLSSRQSAGRIYCFAAD